MFEISNELLEKIEAKIENTTVEMITDESLMACHCSGNCGQSCRGGCEMGCSGSCGRSCSGGAS